MPGPWEKYTQAPQGAPAPAFPGVIQGAPDPFKQEDQQFQRNAEVRAAEDQQIQREKNQLEREKLDMERGELKDGQAKAAGFLQRAVGANTVYEASGVGPRSYLGEAAEDFAPRLVNAVSSTERQSATQAERDFIAAVLRLESGAAISPQEFESQALIYFPQPGEGPEIIKQKADARRRALEQLRLQAGSAGEGVEFAPYEADKASAITSFWNSQKGNANLTVEQAQAFYQSLGEQADPAMLEDAVRKAKAGAQFVPYDADDSSDPAVAAEAAGLDRTFGEAGAFDLAKQGLTLGLMDEATGVGTAISGVLQGDLNIGENYRLGRDAQELRLNQARERLGGLGAAAEFAGGFALPANALAKVGSIGAAARGGAVAGGVGGFGYGRDEASGNNALLGAAGGALLGAGGQRIGNALANRATANLGDRARSLNAAGQAEGVTVNRAMVDPQSNNAISKADATLMGGRTVQREMGAIEGQIEGRVSELGRGGQAMDDIATGDKVKGAAERFIDRSGKAAKAKYDRAEKLAGNAKVTPQESVRRVDEMIAELGETGNTNSAEIAFLQGIKADLSNDLSVGALRRMRTSLRKKISKGDLTFGESEARVLSIMDGAADDIRAGLTAQGNAKAAQAFDSADKAYRARMEYINGTVQKLIGKRGANLPAEQIARKFQSMTGNDARGLRKFYATLDPDEQADVAATFAEQLGKNNKGDFSVAHFLSQSEKMSDEAIRTIFGPQGAESIKNLRTLGAEVNRVTGAMNSRSSKSGVASYRDWLWSLASGGVGLAGGGGVGAAGAAAAGVAGATAAKQLISARLLMSPKIGKWLNQAPRTTNPKAIDQHFERLGEIAKAEPALAQDIDALRQGIMGAANDNTASVTNAAAEDESGQK